MSVLRSLSMTVPGRLEHGVAELRAIVAAVDAGDAEAAAAACARRVEEAGRAGQLALSPAGQGLTHFHRLYDRRTLSLPIGRDRSGP